jgi:hypothetical protein
MPLYTSMATLAGYTDLGNTFDLRDLQGGLVARWPYDHEQRERTKAVIRATLRSMDTIVKNQSEVVRYLQKDFGLEAKIAVETFKILGQIVNADGGIEEPVLKSIIERIKQESAIGTDVPLDRLVDLSILREARTELQK